MKDQWGKPVSVKINTYKVGLIKTNCYFVVNEDNKQGFVIDPGDEAEELIIHINNTGIEPVAILLTHGHFDHISAVNGLKEYFNIPVFAGEAEKELLADPNMNWSELVHNAVSLKADTYLKDGEILNIAGLELKVIATPGHTSGGVTYLLSNENIAFVGDTLFAGGYGRTDCPTGDNEVLFSSIREKLFILPPETEIYPGHGYKSSVGQEKAYGYC